MRAACGGASGLCSCLELTPVLVVSAQLARVVRAPAFGGTAGRTPGWGCFLLRFLGLGSQSLYCFYFYAADVGGLGTADEGVRFPWKFLQKNRILPKKHSMTRSERFYFEIILLFWNIYLTDIFNIPNRQCLGTVNQLATASACP